MARVTRAEAKARTRERLISEAKRLFREHGYAATSLEEVAEAAEVTKGAIYGHFKSKEDLLLSAIEAAPTPDYALLNDPSRPLRERLSQFGWAAGEEAAACDPAELAVDLEFLAALLRGPEALARYAATAQDRLRELAAADPDEPLRGAAVEVWAIGQALYVGLQIYRFLAPDIITPPVFARAFEMLADFYPEA